MRAGCRRLQPVYNMRASNEVYQASKENHQAVGTGDLRVKYCYARISTQTPVRTLPDLITGEVRDSVWLAEEFMRFASIQDRNAFIASFDNSEYKPKQLTKRSMRYGQNNECCDIDKTTGDTVATGVSTVKTSQVTKKAVNQ